MELVVEVTQRRLWRRQRVAIIAVATPPAVGESVAHRAVKVVPHGGIQTGHDGVRRDHLAAVLREVVHQPRVFLDDRHVDLLQSDILIEMIRGLALRRRLPREPVTPKLLPAARVTSSFPERRISGLAVILERRHVEVVARDEIVRGPERVERIARAFQVERIKICLEVPHVGHRRARARLVSGFDPFPDQSRVAADAPWVAITRRVIVNVRRVRAGEA